MAIKPNDCVIRIEDLVIGYETTQDWSGRPQQTPVYETYWANFLEHVKVTTDYKSGWDAYDRNFVYQLKKFNAIYKNTKKHSDRYVKFDKHSDLTFFVLKWG